MDWSEAACAAAVLAVDPQGVGGVVLRAAPGPIRDQLLEVIRGLLPEGTPLRRVPLNISDNRLLGGVDIAATLRAGEPIADRGLLVEADGGLIVLAMAERLEAATAAHVAAALDTGEVALERDGFGMRTAARFGVIALDEGIAPEERPPGALLDRLALHLDLTGCRLAATESHCSPDDVHAARARLPGVAADASSIAALCETALALGIVSLRAPQLALRVARALAALAGRNSLADEDIATAARFVLGPRAISLPERQADDQSQTRPDDEGSSSAGRDEDSGSSDACATRELLDVVIEAALAAVPTDLLEAADRRARRDLRSRSGRFGPAQPSWSRGRPIGVRLGAPRGSARLHLIETLRAAAPWQRVRRRGQGGRPALQVEVRVEDFRLRRFRQRTPTTRVFVVDASGSSAMHRLAEVKGAVELVLADCYVRRDRVALLAFRSQGAELLLPPTRSLARAKRALTGMPGGGATPLASGIHAAVMLADSIRRRGELPMLIVLTDGRANVAIDGTPGRAQAQSDALQASQLVRAMEFDAVLVDTSPRPNQRAQQIAEAMQARYVPLPFADARALSRAVQERAVD